MATALKLKADIKKLKGAIASPKTPKNFIGKLKAQLDKAENELSALKGGAKPRKVSTTKGSKSLLDRAKALVKKNPKYSGYKSSGVDLKKDAEEGALAVGRRVSKGIKGNQYADKKSAKGNVYYEYRMNRLDVKQPKGKQSYPKLEDGGYMGKGGKSVGFTMYYEPQKNLGGKSVQSDAEIRGNYKDMDKVLDKKLGDNYLGSNFYISDGYGKVILQDEKGTDKVKEILEMFDFEDKTSMYSKANGGMMAKGGKIGMPEWAVTITNENGDSYDWDGFAKNEDDAIYKAEKEAGFESVESGVNMITDENGKKIEYKKGGYMAKGGVTKGDVFVEKDEDYERVYKVMEVRNDNGKKTFVMKDTNGNIEYFDNKKLNKLTKKNSFTKFSDGGYMADGGTAEGYHQMPDGSTMANSAHMANGGETQGGVDLFEDYDEIPPNVQSILDKHSEAFEDGDYRKIQKALNELKKIGYTFEYDYDGQAHDLRKIGQKGKSEMANGGYMAKGGMVAHGLRINDKIVGGRTIGNTIRVRNESFDEDARVDLNSGKRTILVYDKKTKKFVEKMAHGGNLGAIESKAHRYDK